MFQLWVAVVTQVIGSVILLVGLGLRHIIDIVVSLFVGVIVAYFVAHLGWFAVVKKGGCCCLILCCCEGPPLLFLWGLCAACWGFIEFFRSFQWIGECSICIINTVLQAFYAVTLIYMGICSIRMWRQGGSEIIPPSFQLKGPQGQAVGEASSTA